MTKSVELVDSNNLDLKDDHDCHEHSKGNTPNDECLLRDATFVLHVLLHLSVLELHVV